MNTPIQTVFGICIRQFRKKTGLSQEKFALKIDMDRTYYASVEAGKRNLSLVNIQKSASAFIKAKTFRRDYHFNKFFPCDFFVWPESFIVISCNNTIFSKSLDCVLCPFNIV